MGFEKLTIDIEHAVMNRCKDLIGVEAQKGVQLKRWYKVAAPRSPDKDAVALCHHGIMNC